MIRVAHLITGLEAGGAERSLATLVARLDPRFGSEVISLVEPGPMAREIRAAGIPVTSLSMRRGAARGPSGLAGLAGLMRLVRHLRETRPAVLQTWLYHADLMGLAAGRLAGVPHIAWNIRCSDMTPDGEAPNLRRVTRLLARLSAWPDAVIVNSAAGRTAHEALGYGPRRWVEIPNGVDPARFRPRPEMREALRRKLGFRPSATVVGLVARLHPMKDHETFLRAAALFAAGRPDAEFALCGDGCVPGAEPLARLVSALGLENRVHFLGTRADMEDVYPAFDLAALSSAYGEGFPNTLVEAMACAVPCVATNVGDAERILGSAGLVVRPRDPAALAGAWAETLAGDRAAHGLQVRERAVAEFALERVLARYEALYDGLVGEGAQTRASGSERNSAPRRPYGLKAGDLDVRH